MNADKPHKMDTEYPETYENAENKTTLIRECVNLAKWPDEADEVQASAGGIEAQPTEEILVDIGTKKRKPVPVRNRLPFLKLN